MTLKNNKLAALLLFVIAIALSSCVYSFSGTSLPPEIKTISISTFPNNSGAGLSFLSPTVTNTVRNYFQRNTSLDLVKRDGDLQLDGQIIGYTITPVAPQEINGIPVAARNRLTITLQVKYTNTVDPKQNFDSPFTGIEDLPQNLNPNSIDESIIRNIVENKMLVEIFNRTVANW
jgi:hypothetical protein